MEVQDLLFRTKAFCEKNKTFCEGMRPSVREDKTCQGKRHSVKELDLP